MSNYNAEQERLKRLRDRQIADRDPSVKQQKFHRESAARERRAYKPLTARDTWSDIPHIWKGAFFGLVIGLVLMFVITYLWSSTLVFIGSLILVVVCILMGAMIGRAADSREDMKYNLR
jgi:hypothetical protein